MFGTSDIWDQSEFEGMNLQTRIGHMRVFEGQHLCTERSVWSRWPPEPAHIHTHT